MQNKYLQKAEEISEIIKLFFRSKVSKVTPCIADEDNYPWFKVTFVMYRTYEISYEYERGYYTVRINKDISSSGIVLDFSEKNQKKFDSKGFDQATIEHNLRILDEELRLRLPDKFLTQFD